jgi:hypothetical protein
MLISSQLITEDLTYCLTLGFYTFQIDHNVPEVLGSRRLWKGQSAIKITPNSKDRKLG